MVLEEAKQEEVMRQRSEVKSRDRHEDTRALHCCLELVPECPVPTPVLSGPTLVLDRPACNSLQPQPATANYCIWLNNYL